MRSLVLIVSLVLLCCSSTLAQPADPNPHAHAVAAPVKGGSLLQGLGTYHHPIATKSAQAQALFNQGLTLVFGFNHEEAIRSFQAAANLDPSAVMPLWGIAYALGPNINLPVDPPREKRAYETVQKALALAKESPESERAYVEALATRYSGDENPDLDQLSKDYAKAMKVLTRRYPDDLDAATLYAEAMMDLRPWKLYDLQGNPAEGTEEIVAVLESVLRRDPTHPGANHYYIHAVEASRNPERALASAKTLETLVPKAGHLVHMPAHIYSRTGDHAGAAHSNAIAAQVDQEYLKTSGTQGSLYSLMYYGHNLHFLAYSATLAGSRQEAEAAADRVVALAAPAVPQMPMVEFVMPAPLFVMLRFGDYAGVLKAKEPSPSMATTRALWRFFRGMALASQGKADAAGEERDFFKELAAKAPKDAPYSGTGLSTSGEILAVAAQALDARIASAKGDHAASIEAWKAAIAAQDRLAYDEPPAWFYSLRESLGGEYLRAGKMLEAEKTFREDLEKRPRNPRSLRGLAKALEAQGRKVDAEWVKLQYEAAWKGDGAPSLDAL